MNNTDEKLDQILRLKTAYVKKVNEAGDKIKVFEEKLMTVLGTTRVKNKWNPTDEMKEFETTVETSGSNVIIIKASGIFYGDSNVHLHWHECDSETVILISRYLDRLLDSVLENLLGLAKEIS